MVLCRKRFIVFLSSSQSFSTTQIWNILRFFEFNKLFDMQFQTFQKSMIIHSHKIKWSIIGFWNFYPAGIPQEFYDETVQDRCCFRT